MMSSKDLLPFPLLKALFEETVSMEFLSFPPRLDSIPLRKLVSLTGMMITAYAPPEGYTLIWQNQAAARGTASARPAGGSGLRCGLTRSRPLGPGKAQFGSRVAKR